ATRASTGAQQQQQPKWIVGSNGVPRHEGERPLLLTKQLPSRKEKSSSGKRSNATRPGPPATNNSTSTAATSGGTLSTGGKGGMPTHNSRTSNSVSSNVVVRPKDDRKQELLHAATSGNRRSDYRAYSPERHTKSVVSGRVSGHSSPAASRSVSVSEQRAVLQRVSSGASSGEPTTSSASGGGPQQFAAEAGGSSGGVVDPARVSQMLRKPVHIPQTKSSLLRKLRDFEVEPQDSVRFSWTPRRSKRDTAVNLDAGRTSAAINVAAPTSPVSAKNSP
ncbi:unnamed protein product, partial [Amoebophrya sp. A25]